MLQPKSARIKGVADSHYADRRKIVQRPPLTVNQILMLERTVHDEARTSYDRIGCWFLLDAHFWTSEVQ